MNRFLIGIILVLGAVTAHAQDFFADEQNKDTIAKGFYEQKNHGTILYSNGYPANWYGGSLLIHYNKERFSPYVEFRVNPTLAKSYNFLKEPSNTSKDTSNKSAKLSYRYYNLSIGMAAAARKNLLVYATIGLRYQKSLPNTNNSIPVGYYLVPKDDQLTVIYGGGLLFIIPMGLTFQLGFELSKFTVIPGIGYTF